MHRSIGLVNLVQGGVYLFFAAELGARWAPAGWMLWLAAGLQALAGLSLLSQRAQAKVVPVAAGVSLLVCGVILGLHVQVGAHIIERFTPVADKQSWAFLGSLGAALPWAVFFPLGQLFASLRGRVAGAGAGVAALVAVLPFFTERAALAPETTYAAQDGAGLTAALYGRWSGVASAAPAAPGAALVNVSVVKGGKVLESKTLRSDSSGELVNTFTLETAYDPDAGLVVEVATAEGALRLPPLAPRGIGILRPGEDGLLIDGELLPAWQAWQHTVAVEGRAVVPGVDVSVLNLKLLKAGKARRWARTQGFVATAAGVTPMKLGWAAPPAAEPDALLAAALAGGRHILHNMGSDGRYAYQVIGPTGDYGKGYNFPRHAGGTWFLSRLASRTGDAEIRQGALLGLEYMKRNTRTTQDGRAYVYDPTRNDGKAWVGTTALGLLAFTEAGVEPELQARYAAFIASAVDERGAVRGDMDVATGEWPKQDEVTYAQGQGLLGLAAAERAGLPGVKEALDRAAAYVDGDYWTLPAANFKILDEHWMCIAAVAVHEVRGVAAGEAVCRAYLADQARYAPTPGNPEQPLAGPAAGLAEAVIALAEIDRRKGLKATPYDRAIRYGASLLGNAYQAADAPFLGRPERLIGGFRDRPWKLMVQVDAVQHVGCALLGVEQLLRGEALPGAMP